MGSMIDLGGGDSTREDPYLRPPKRPWHDPIPMRRWLVLLGVGLLVYEFIFSSRGIVGFARERRAVTQATARRAEIELETERLAELRKRLESGQAVEETAREMYGMARPGEEIFVLPAPETERQGRKP
jgi:cell division protein FtsB